MYSGAYSGSGDITYSGRGTGESSIGELSFSGALFSSNPDTLLMGISSTSISG
jgi:hypothetical protein